MFSRLDNIRKNVFENGKVLNNIDLACDVDTELSGKYRIDNEKGYLEFLYSEVDTVKSDEYLTVLGEMVTINGEINAHPILDSRIDDHNYHAHMLVNRNIAEEQAYIVHIEFKYEKDSEVQLRLNNSYEYDFLSSFMSNKTKLRSDYFNDKSINSIIARFKDNSFSFLHREDGSFRQFYTSSFEGNEKNVFIMDIKQGIALINDKKVNVNRYYKFKSDINYITYTCDSHRSDTKLVIRNTNFGMGNGYIYIKPFQLDNKRYKIVQVCTGNPEMQYYCRCSACLTASCSQYMTVNFAHLSCPGIIPDRIF